MANRFTFTSYDSKENWFVHFCKEKEHATQILKQGVILPDKDGITWAIPVGAGYNKSQVETEPENNEKGVIRESAILFDSFEKPTSVFKGLAAWDGKVEILMAFEISFEEGKRLCTYPSNYVIANKIFEYDEKGAIISSEY